MGFVLLFLKLGGYFQNPLSICLSDVLGWGILFNFVKYLGVCVVC